MASDACRPGEARFPGPSVQDVLETDGDRPLQPPAYRQTSYRFLGDAPIAFDRYLSREFHEAEMRHVWPRTWQWACREEHIPAPGDYHVYDIGCYSLIVTRTESGAVRAYHNSCLHRGTKLKPSYSEGHGSQFVCPFHGWSWTLEGELSHLPCAWDFPHMTGTKTRLPEAQVARWGGFIFVNMDPDAPPFEDYIAPLAELAGHAELENRFVALHVQKELNCNWKIAQEAFIESYHGLTTHPQTAPSNSVYNAQYDILGAHLGRMFLNLARAEPTLGELSQDDMLNGIVIGGQTAASLGLTVPEGSTARAVMAEFFRRSLADTACDYSHRSITELIDVIGYVLFPNGHFFMSPALGQVHRIRPLGNDHEKALFELLILAPLPKSGRPEPAEPVRLRPDESYTTAPNIDPALAGVYDQDTRNMVWQQEGMAASATGAEELGNYQEVLIRHIHQNLDRYIGMR